MVWNTETILLGVFVAFTGVAVALQAAVLFAIFLSLKKTAKSALEATDDFKATVLPLVAETRVLVERITPQIITISADLAELTELLKRESRGVSISASEIMQRVNRQTERLDAMLTVGLNSVERAGAVVETAIAAPVRQANGIVAAIKAMISTYQATDPKSTPKSAPISDLWSTDARRKTVDAVNAGRNYDPEI
jgi:hypothetical protein